MILINNNTNKNESTVIAGMKSTSTLNALMNRQANTYEIVKKAKSDKDLVIDVTKAYSIPALLSRLGYVAGSMVGIITNLIEVSSVFMDNKYNTQFLIEGTTTVDMKKMKKVFKTIGDAAMVDGYTSLFSEEQSNVLLVENKQARLIRLVKALKIDIQRFVDALESAKTLQQEDLVRIGQDLEKIGRVMQELEIDSAKDATVKEGMLEITEFMNAYTCKLTSKKIKIENNFNEIVSNFKAKVKKDVAFKYEIGEYKDLNDFYTLIDEDLTEYMNQNPHATTEDLVDAKIKATKNAYSETLINDAAGELKHMMVAQQSEFIGGLVSMYNNSNMNLFEEFRTVDADPTVVSEIQRITIIAIEMIYNHFKYAKHIPMTKIDDLAKTLRNAIYTLGEARGLSLEDTFKAACSAGWLKRTNYRGVEQIVPNHNYRYAAITALFETELKWHFNRDAMYSTIEVEIPYGLSLAPNTVLRMENGECEVELDNGEIDFITCIDEDDFNGIVIAKIINNEPVFVKHVNEFEYEAVDFVIFDKICDVTTANNKFMVGDKEAIVSASAKIVETNTMGMIEEDKEKAEKQDALRLQNVFKLWANAMELSVSNKEKYKLFSNAINGTAHLSLRNEAGQARMLGSILTAVKGNMAEYNTTNSLVCASGAIVILNK